MRELPIRSAGQHAGQARLPSRAEVRELSTRHQQELLGVAGAGGNVHQRSLDQLDQVKRYAALLSPDEGSLFLTMYAEETRALAAHLESEQRVRAARAASYSYFNPRPLDQQSLGEKIGRGVVAMLVLLVVLQMCR